MRPQQRTVFICTRHPARSLPDLEPLLELLELKCWPGNQGRLFQEKLGRAEGHDIQECRKLLICLAHFWVTLYDTAPTDSVDTKPHAH